MAPERVVFGTEEVARITGATKRQLQWWDERQVVPVREDAHKRMYDRQDVLRVCMIVELMRKGLSLGSVKLALHLAQRVAGRYIAFALYPRTTCPRYVAGSDSPEDIVRITNDWDCPAVVVDRQVLDRKISQRSCQN